jgi:hypothetical protein
MERSNGNARALVEAALDARVVGGALNAGRVALGATALAAPGLARRLLVRPEDRRPVIDMFTRLVGVRDVALGVATVGSLRDPARARRLLWLGVLCDLSDAAATIRQRDVPRAARYLTTAVALAGVAAGAHAAVHLPDLPDHGATPEASAVV